MVSPRIVDRRQLKTENEPTPEKMPVEHVLVLSTFRGMSSVLVW